MRYHAPSGSTDPDAHYLGKNVQAQQQGSKIPPQAIEYTQREIVNTIASAGLTPDDDDLNQLLRAIRGGGLTTYTDQSFTPGLIKLTSTVPHKNYRSGMRLSVILNTDVPDGGLNVNLDGLGNKPVTYHGGSLISKGYFLKGDLLDLIYSFRYGGFIVQTPVDGTIIDNAVSVTVGQAGADFPDFTSAYRFFSRRRVGDSGSVTITSLGQLPISSDQVFVHPNGDRFTIAGLPVVGTLPEPGAVIATGNSLAQRTTDTANNLAVLRTNFPSEIVLSGTAKMVFRSNIGLLSDLLISTNTPINNNQTNLVFSGSKAKIRRVASLASGYAGLTASRSEIDFEDKNYFLGNYFFGMMFETGSKGRLLPGSKLVWNSNGQYGPYANVGGLIGVEDITATGPVGYARCNGTDNMVAHSGQIIASVNWSSIGGGQNGIVGYNGGIFRGVGMTISGNLNGASAGNNSYVDASNTSGANTQYAFTAYQFGKLYRPNSTATGGTATASPAIGSTGSDGGQIL